MSDTTVTIALAIVAGLYVAYLVWDERRGAGK
jgi:hypothetical protein